MLNISDFTCGGSNKLKNESLKVKSLKNKFIRFSRHIVFISFVFKIEDHNKLKEKIIKWLKQKIQMAEHTWVQFYMPNLNSINKYAKAINELRKICRYSTGNLFTVLHPINPINSLKLPNKDFRDYFNFNYLFFDINEKELNLLEKIKFYTERIKRLNRLGIFQKLILCFYNIDNHSNPKNIIELVDSISEKIDKNIIEVVKIPFFPCWQKEALHNSKFSFFETTSINLLREELKSREIPFTFNWFTNYSYCFAEHWNHFLIDLEGNFYQCFSQFFKNKIIGSINEQGIEKRNFSLFYSFISKDPFEIKQCIQCPFLEYCYGGCKNELLSNCPLVKKE
ncbi:MAG: SPASM domain-containing protein [Candidatus Cloacimonadota bacterium]|nr:SPASM domain-containing protein [Candidatus Cloacimonadota bacterium]